MGQLFDRLRNYVRASVPSGMVPNSTSWADRMIDSEDDELRRIIEELSREGAPAAGNSDTRSGATTSSRPRPAQALPPEVLKAHTTLNVAPTADVAAIRQAYRSAIARWHPDRHANATADEQAHAHRRAREINHAYATLKAYYSIP